LTISQLGLINKQTADSKPTNQAPANVGAFIYFKMKNALIIMALIVGALMACKSNNDVQPPYLQKGDNIIHADLNSIPELFDVETATEARAATAIPAANKIYAVFKVVNPCSTTGTATGQQLAFYAETSAAGSLKLSQRTVDEIAVKTANGFSISTVKPAFYEKFLKRVIDKSKNYLVLVRNRDAKKWNVIARWSTEDDMFLYFPYRRNWTFISCEREDSGEQLIE
ncbi:hypothetical protein, partial [Arsenicibacter rosenii]|uniref:hypothetical protein n=1 Tax=Arsenicibacter rosenii TaxID=1750698 RepID=UPI001C4354E2